MSLVGGTRLGPYEIVSPLGAGGMGEVYKARDTRLGRDVAIKVLPSEFAQDPERLRRFEQEAKATAALDHPNILAVFDIGTHGGTPYIVEQLLEGESLRERLRGGPLPPAKVVALAIQISSGLAAAHGKGIVHRDIKPENIFVAKDGRIRILDFGLAKLLERHAPIEGGATESVTRDVPTETGRVMGTIGYMAPEQARGEPTDARSDVFSFGVVLYEMLSGKRPFERHSTADTFAALLKEDPPPLPKGLPSPLDRVVRRCLEKRPQDRYASAGELSLALETLSETSLRHSGPMAFLPSGTRGWPARWLPPLALLVLLGLAVAGVLIWRPWAPHRRTTGVAAVAGRAVRLAVLPFANLSGDPGQDYLSDGLTQEMISQLGSLHPQSLSVIARTSVMRYKKTDTPIDQIGRELNVDCVLEGSARREGNRIRVTAELVQVSDQSQLWAQTYERELSGILPLQTDVARNVADALALKLLPAERAQLAGARAVNAEAYEAYLKGSQYWTRLTAADLDTAERYFDLALEKDPRFAPAHASLAMVWACRQQMGFVPPSEAGPKAKAEARRALDLDDTVALAHFALATVLTWTDWDFPAAGKEWARAIELDPGDALARANYSHYLMIVGRPGDAMSQIEAALKADPFNVLPRVFYGVDLVFLRRYEEALAAANESLRMQPGSPAALSMKWLVSARMGKWKEAFEAAREYLVVVYQDSRAAQACDEGYAKGGYTEAMRRAAEALAGRFRTSFVLPSDIACYYLGAGNHARTLDWLEKGYEVRDPVLPYLGWGFYDSLRPEPRFLALVKKMNLPTEIPAGPPQPSGPPP